MNTPEALLERIGKSQTNADGIKRLILLLTQLGDFDSMEYAQALVPELPRLEQAGIRPLAIAIGDQAGAERFCEFTGLPRELLQVEPDARLHQALDLSPGLQAPGGPWPSLLLMCAGIGSPGTLAEVLRGYTGDRSAPQRFSADEIVSTGVLPPIPAGLFRRAGGEGFQRPFELATVRLRNMNEVLRNWSTYVPDDRFITQRGGTFLLDSDDSLLYVYRDRGILGFSATMQRPLAFLDPWLNHAE
jgi:hypothetical protein|tara:strand:+ start:512 stop:1246 length:735 start_codon:yes stop_codon:yes gene_type:complete